MQCKKTKRKNILREQTRIMNEKLSAIIKNLPERPGVYLMRDSEGKVIYVGKAKKLKRRVSSYFRHSHSSPRLNKLVSLIEDISTIRTETEAEALIVEAKLIRRYSPFFNIELKMGDKYPYVKITNEEYPRLEITRHKYNDGAVYLGPFVDAGNIRNLMRLSERYFPLRVCSKKINPDSKKRPCIEYTLGHSMGACAALCSKSEYLERAADIILLFEGKSAELVERLRERMNDSAKKLEFEKAAKYRDTIRAIWKLTRQKISSALQEDLDNETWHVLNQIQDLLHLHVLPWRIDAFDISHTHGHDTYGCCVVFEQGRPSPNLYRRFKIRSLEDGEINDFASMYETVKRRYRHVLDNSEPSPQLALIDGGPGQLEYAQRAIHELGMNLPMIALAEREELIFLPESNTPLRLERDDPALQLLQRLRDEVHRYAITTHRHARGLRVRHSRLDDIHGIGKKTAAELLVKFGSVKRIAALSPEELMKVPGIGPVTAKRILDELCE
ncbi:MAG: excinuclease ABC subunit UvrC [Synergistaceae bacterium]|nr:excinuclease ABC subunit UvrC [Synergistaceae bacterium]